MLGMRVSIFMTNMIGMTTAMSCSIVMVFNYPEFLESFFNFEALGKYFRNYDVQEYSNNDLIEII